VALVFLASSAAAFVGFLLFDCFAGGCGGLVGLSFNGGRGRTSDSLCDFCVALDLVSGEDSQDDDEVFSGFESLFSGFQCLGVHELSTDLRPSGVRWNAVFLGILERGNAFSNWCWIFGELLSRLTQDTLYRLLLRLLSWRRDNTELAVIIRLKLVTWSPFIQLCSDLGHFSRVLGQRFPRCSNGLLRSSFRHRVFVVECLFQCLEVHGVFGVESSGCRDT